MTDRDTERPYVAAPSLAERQLPRPEPDPAPGPRDTELYDLVERRFRRIVTQDPTTATYLGIHDFDDRLGDGSRDAVLAEIAADRAHLAAVEAIDPADLSPTARFEQEVELHGVRLGLFEADTIRRWERGSSGLDAVGDALFLGFAGDFAPLADRLAAIAGRLSEVPAFLAAHRTRAVGPQVGRWQTRERASVETLPALIDEIEGAAADALAGAALRQLSGAAAAARAAIVEYGAFLDGTLVDGTDDWALGRELHDAYIARRAFDGLTSDDILAIGHAQLALHHAARDAAAREIDPTASTGAVIDRLKSDHPATFEEALDGYRETMHRARAYLVEHDLVSIPPDERLAVVPTPEYLRNVMPFAAYFAAPAFDPGARGLYVVTPSVDDDPDAMREHYRASISNTSIHEAYPGHHLQISVASRNPSLSRLLVHAPEFIEGWGMYCELMMREQGFDDGPAFRMAMATDAIWRACRIILDVRMHRGELSVDEATDFLVAQTGMERPNARAEVERYTTSPTGPLSYLLGRVLILALRADEQRRLGDRFRLREFHDALLRNGSLPVSFHRRALAAHG